MVEDPIKSAIKQLNKDGTLDPCCVPSIFHQIEEQRATDAQLGAFLALLSRERCTKEIVTAFAKEFRKRSAPCFDGSAGVDIVGTGGDGICYSYLQTFLFIFIMILFFKRFKHI